MTGMMFSKPEDNPQMQRFGGDYLPTTYAETLSAAIGDPLLRPTQMLNQQYEIESQGREIDPAFPMFTPESAPEPEELESPEKLNEKYGYLGLKFDEPTHPASAEVMAHNKRDERRRQSIIDRGPQGVFPAAGRFVASFLGAAADPLNIASAFIPVAREARMAGMLSRVGQRSVTAQRAATGAIEGFAGAALVEPAVYGLAKSQQLDYEMADALMNLAIGTVLGAGLHPAAGKVGDYLKTRSYEVREAGFKKGLADAVEGRSIDVDDVVDVGGAEKLDLSTRGEPRVAAATRDVVDAHPDTAKAKNGSMQAARQVIEDTANDLNQIPTLPDYDLVPVKAPKQGKDKLPEALAEKLQEESGGTIVGDFKVTQGKDGLKVTGKVKPGKDYLLTADGEGAKDAIDAVAQHINEGGGHVAGVFHAVEPEYLRNTTSSRSKFDPFANPGRPVKPTKLDDEAKRIVEKLAREVAEADMQPERDATADFDAAKEIDLDDAEIASIRETAADIDEADLVDLTDEELAEIRQADADIAQAEQSTDAVMEAAACILRNTP